MLAAALEEASAARDAAVEAALERGREEGRQTADQLGAERLHALREALAQTSVAWRTRLQEDGDMAIEIARAAVHKILGEANPRAALAAEIVRNAVAQIAAGTIVAVRVSASDFANDDELAALADDLGAIRIVRDRDLSSGGCELELIMGTVDASLGTQLALLDRELDPAGERSAS